MPLPESSTPSIEAAGDELEQPTPAPRSRSKAKLPKPGEPIGKALPSFVQKMGGLTVALAELNRFCEENDLPVFLVGEGLNLNDYRLVLCPPRGIPFRLGLRLIYKPGTAEERELEYTARVAR